MSTLVEKLEGAGESAGFLNDIIALLWPNINVAGSKMIKEIAEPMFKTMLPGPLASLHFTKVDLGHVPLVFSNVRVTKTVTDGIKLDLDVDWDGKCDIDLDADMMPGVGVKHIQLHGRLSMLLCPLTNVIPLIGAAQVAFVNTPSLKLDFTGAADVADFSLINSSVLKIILGIINSMAVLPNRFLVKLDANNDYFKTYLYPHGIIRVTVGKAYGFAEETKSKSKKLFSKLTGASPDCYAEVSVGAEEPWRTTTKNNTTTPVWNETHDFVVSDLDQQIKIDISDHDVNSDDEVGLAVTTVQEILAAGGKQELAMSLKGEETSGLVSLACEFYQFAAEGNSFTASAHKGDGKVCGVLTILIAGASNISGARAELNPSILVTWGSRHRFQTAVKTDAPGTDINNPSFDQSFRVLVTPDMVAHGAEDLRIVCMNKETEVGGADVGIVDLMNAPDMTLQDSFEIGGGARVRASFCLRGVKEAGLQDLQLPVREKS